MVHMEGVQVESVGPSSEARDGPDIAALRVVGEREREREHDYDYDYEQQQQENEFVFIDENSILGRRRHSIEERNERKRLLSGEQLDCDDDITLYPFAHQVGGHTQLLSLDKGTLCKPLVPRELLFYLNVPKGLTTFVPAYKGVVQISETATGNYQPVLHQPLRSRKSPFAVSIRNANNAGSKAAPSGQQQQRAQLVRNKSIDCEPTCMPFELHVQLRPFSDEKLLKKNLSQENLLGADYISRPNEKYLLLLENVASKYQLPCILDLKMGTRQHGDDASEEKRHRQIAKCQASTSASLGVRLCGMQVYKVDYGGYLWYDKYCGRKLDERGLKRALREYFRAGSQLNGTIIDETIAKLQALHEAVLGASAFRFYGTSLLIIHESFQTGADATKATSTTNKPPPVDVRLIDFAHTICDLHPNGGRASSSPSILKSASGDELTKLGVSTGSQRASAPLNEEGENLLRSGEAEDKTWASNHEATHQNFSPQRSDSPQRALQLSKRHNQAELAVTSNGAEGPLNMQAKTTLTNLGDCSLRPPRHESVAPNKLNEPTDKQPKIVLSTSEEQQSSSLLFASRKISRNLIEPDKGLLFGLKNLMRLLEELKSETN